MLHTVKTDQKFLAILSIMSTLIDIWFHSPFLNVHWFYSSEEYNIQNDTYPKLQFWLHYEPCLAWRVRHVRIWRLSQIAQRYNRQRHFFLVFANHVFQPPQNTNPPIALSLTTKTATTTDILISWKFSGEQHTQQCFSLGPKSWKLLLIILRSKN